MNGAWLYGVHRMHRDGSSFMWHQRCNNQTVLWKYTTLVDIQKYAVKSDSHSFRITCNKSSVRLLKRREQCYRKVINNNYSPVDLVLSMHIIITMTYIYIQTLNSVKKDITVIITFMYTFLTLPLLKEDEEKLIKSKSLDTSKRNSPMLSLSLNSFWED